MSKAKELTERINKILNSLNEQQLNEMSLQLSDCKTISEFRNKALNFKEGEDREFIVFKGIRITTDTIRHAKNNHFGNMDNNDWEHFVKTFDPQTDLKLLSKKKKRGIPRYMYKCAATNGKFYAYLLEDAGNIKGPIMITAVKDTEKAVDAWIKRNT